MTDQTPRKWPRAGLADVAARAGVGIATVDRVLNERGNVSQKTTLKVLEAARALSLRRTLPSVRYRNLRIEVILRKPETEYFERLNQAFQKMAGALDRSIVVQRNFVEESRPQDLARQISTSKANAIILYSAIEHPGVVAAIAEATGRNVPVVTITTDLPSSCRTVHIGADHHCMGRTAAFFMAGMARASGAVIVVRYNETYKGHEERVSGFVEGLAQRRPDLTVTDILSGQDQPSLTYQLVYKALSQRENVVGIYNAGGGRRGVGSALENTGLAGRVVYIAHELTEQSSRMLRTGVLTLALDQNPEEQARQSLGYLLQHFEYTSGFFLTPIPFSVISEETIENYHYGFAVPT